MVECMEKFALEATRVGLISTNGRRARARLKHDEGGDL